MRRGRIAFGERDPVRLRARLDSRVKVPVEPDTEGFVTESNCAGAISPGGEQLEVNDQSVTTVNSIRSAVLASLLDKGEARSRRPAPGQCKATGREPQMVGDRMIGSPSEVNQGTTAGGERAGRGQSLRSSGEAGNDRGAKGGRDVVLEAAENSSHKGLGSAVRLNARMHRGKTGLSSWGDSTVDRLREQVSGAQACAAGATLPIALSRVPEPVHRRPRTGKPDAGDPPVRFGWRATE